MKINVFTQVNGDIFEQESSFETEGFTWNTGVYDVVIKNAYVDQSRGGAYSLNFVFERENGKTLKNTQYVTNREGNGFYVNKKTGKQVPLPGAVTANAVAYCATGKMLNELDAEDKPVMIYDYDVKKEVPQNKKVMIDMIGKKIKLAVFKVQEYKNADDGTGKWVPTDTIKEFNDIAQAFTISGSSPKEQMSGENKGKTLANFEKKFNSDYVKDKCKNVKPVIVNNGSPFGGDDNSTPIPF